MRRRKPADEHKLWEGEAARQQQVLLRAKKERIYRRSLAFKLDTWIRIIFFAEVLLSFMVVVVFPFRETDVIRSYSGLDNKHAFTDIFTTGGRKLVFSSSKLMRASIRTGDTIYVEKNLFLKTEAITVKKTGQTYFLVMKDVWLYVQFIFLVAAIASLYFNRAGEIHIKQFLTVVLEILCTLYFFV